MRRILTVQATLERLATWRLIDLETQDVLLQEQRENLFRFLDDETTFGGTFSTSTMRRLQGLAESRAVLKAETDIVAARRREEYRRLRCGELNVGALGRETRRIDELRELESVIEASLHRSRVRLAQG